MLNKPVVNYKAVCPTKSLFLKAVHTGKQAQYAEWITKDLPFVMDSLGENVVGTINDNIAPNKKAWKTLEEKAPKPNFSRMRCTWIKDLSQRYF